MRFQEVAKNGSIKAHEGLGPSNEMRFKILSLINTQKNTFMVITFQRAATGVAGSKLLLGSANTAQFGGKCHEARNISNRTLT